MPQKGDLDILVINQLFFNFVLNALQGICLEVSFAVVDSDMCELLTVLAGMFAIDCVLCRTMSQLFARKKL